MTIDKLQENETDVEVDFTLDSLVDEYKENNKDNLDAKKDKMEIFLATFMDEINKNQKRELTAVNDDGTEYQLEDNDQIGLVSTIQKYRTVLLEVASLAYIKSKGNNPKLLDAIVSLIGNLEKTVRDDRKEKAKKKEKEDNKATFNQLIEAIGVITNKQIETKPELGLVILDPTVSLYDTATNENVGKINPAELSLGIIQLDIDGNEVK